MVEGSIGIARGSGGMERHEGGCLCGAVRYVCDGALRQVVFCHCSQCRKQTGLYYAATSVAKAAVQIDDAAAALRWFAASDFARRGFCGTCGSHLFWDPIGGADLSVLAGSFDDPGALTAGYHICVAGRAGFYDISDGLPQFPQGAPGLAIAGAPG